jgi:hypothetical protein
MASAGKAKTDLTRMSHLLQISADLPTHLDTLHFE